MTFWVIRRWLSSLRSIPLVTSCHCLTAYSCSTFQMFTSSLEVSLHHQTSFNAILWGWENLFVEDCIFFKIPENKGGPGCEHILQQKPSFGAGFPGMGAVTEAAQHPSWPGPLLLPSVQERWCWQLLSVEVCFVPDIFSMT